MHIHASLMSLYRLRIRTVLNILPNNSTRHPSCAYEIVWREIQSHRCVLDATAYLDVHTEWPNSIVPCPSTHGIALTSYCTLNGTYSAKHYVLSYLCSSAKSLSYSYSSVHSSDIPRAGEHELMSFMSK